MSAIVRFGGIEFFGDRFRGHGFHIGPDGFTGWDDGAAVRRDSIPIPNGDGEFDTDVHLGARRPGIRGFVVANSFDELDHMQGRLLGLVGRSDRFMVERGPKTLWADAKVEREPEFNASGFRPEATFRVDWVCPNPRKYGETRDFGPGGTVSAYHYGNTDAPPELIVTGSLPSGYELASQGRQYLVSQSLTAGQTHRIDMRTGRLYRNNVLQIGAAIYADLWTIPSGRAVPTVFTPAAGSGSLTVRVTDTFS